MSRQEAIILCKELDNPYKSAFKKEGNNFILINGAVTEKELDECYEEEAIEDILAGATDVEFGVFDRSYLNKADNGRAYYKGLEFALKQSDLDSLKIVG